MIRPLDTTNGRRFVKSQRFTSTHILSPYLCTYTAAVLSDVALLCEMGARRPAKCPPAAPLLSRSRSDFGALDTGGRIDVGDADLNVFDDAVDFAEPVRRAWGVDDDQPFGSPA